MIRTRGNDDRILAGVVDPDKGHSCRLRSRGVNSTNIDAIGGEAGFQMISKKIIADPADHLGHQRRSPDTAYSAGLVPRLCRRDHLKSGPENGLAGSGEFSDMNNKVHVQTSNDD